MVKSEDLFGKREERVDTIALLIDNMERLSHGMEYEEAKYTLDKIREELKKPATNIWPYTYIYVGNIQTIKDVHDLITSDSIRINPDNYEFSDYLGLLTNVHKRKNELQGARYQDTDRQRRVVAEEMICLGMTITPKKQKYAKMPNRRFMDIAYDINPSICSKELERRSNIELWKAIEVGDKEKIRLAKEKISKYRSFRKV